MTVTIADLAQYSTAGAGLPYFERAEALVTEYRPERAEIVESDCHDQWARVLFGDGSSLIVSKRRGLRPAGRVAQ